MRISRIAAKLFVVLSILTYLFLWAPVIVICIFSFSMNDYGMKWEGFTLKWYAELLRNGYVKDALTRSLVVAAVTIVACIVLGTAAAYGLYKYKFRAKAALRTFALVPLIMPYVITGISLLAFFSKVLRIPLGYPSIILAHITFSLPIAVFIILGRMSRIDWSLEEASLDLGAGRWTTMVKVTLPLLAPAIIASATLIFPWSFDDFVITYFVSGPGNATLPIYVYSRIIHGSTPIINTIGAIFIFIPLIALLLLNLIQKKETVR